MAVYQNSINQARTNGDTNTILGLQAGDATTSSLNVVTIGYRAGRAISSGPNSVFIGYLCQTSGNASNAVGIGSGCMGSAGAHVNCTAVGLNAGASYSNGTTWNCAFGSGAQQSMTSGSQNIGIGGEAQHNVAVTGSYNIGIGHVAQFSLSSGQFNVAIGGQSQSSATITGSDNISIGYNSCNLISTASSNVGIGRDSLLNMNATGNTCVGHQTGRQITSGSYNLILGYNAGFSQPTTQSSNIYLMNAGAAESNTIRIGTQGTGNGQQNRAFVAGIAGTTLATPVGTVLVDANGQLGQGPASNVFNWVEVTGTSENAAVGTGYIANNVGMVTITLPSTFAFGDVIEVGGKGAGLFTVAANTGDTISIVGPTAAGYTTSAGGSLVGNDQYGHLRLIAITANSAWIAIPTGNFTVT